MGALILLVAIPVAGPIVLLLSTPELFMFALVGLVFASSMIGKDLAKGLASACLGLFLGVVGPASAAADFRFTFGQVYLLDGFSLTIVALGLFGVAEAISMLAAGGGISNIPIAVSNWGEGFRDFWRNKWLVLRASIIGVFGGFVPAVGRVGVDLGGLWARDPVNQAQIEIRQGRDPRHRCLGRGQQCHGHLGSGADAAVQRAGRACGGDLPRGVVLVRLLPRPPDDHPEPRSDVPDRLVGGAVVGRGGGDLFRDHPDSGKLTRIPFGIIAAPLILIMVVGAYQSTSTIGDIFMLFALGALGWMMKHAEWPRAPALVGFVLASPMEQYFWLANQIHGWSWLARPGVLIIGSFIVIPLLLNAWRWWRERKAPVVDEAAEVLNLPHAEDHKTVSLILAALVSIAFAYAIWEMTGFNPSSRLMPSLTLLPGLPLALWLLFRAVRDYTPQRDPAFNEPTVLFALLGYAVAIWAIGFSIPTIALLAWMLFARARMRLVPGAIYGAIVFAVVWLLFDQLRGDAPVGAFTGLS